MINHITTNPIKPIEKWTEFVIDCVFHISQLNFLEGRIYKKTTVCNMGSILFDMILYYQTKNCHRSTCTCKIQCILFNLLLGDNYLILTNCKSCEVRIIIYDNLLARKYIFNHIGSILSISISLYGDSGQG